MDERLSLISHQGQKVLLVDLSKCSARRSKGSPGQFQTT